MSKLGKRLIEAAGEALAIARGDVDASTYGVHAPAAIDTRTPARSASSSVLCQVIAGHGKLWPVGVGTGELQELLIDSHRTKSPFPNLCRFAVTGLWLPAVTFLRTSHPITNYWTCGLADVLAGHVVDVHYVFLVARAVTHHDHGPLTCIFEL